MISANQSSLGRRKYRTNVRTHKTQSTSSGRTLPALMTKGYGWPVGTGRSAGRERPAATAWRSKTNLGKSHLLGEGQFGLPLLDKHAIWANSPIRNMTTSSQILLRTASCGF